MTTRAAEDEPLFRVLDASPEEIVRQLSVEEARGHLQVLQGFTEEVLTRRNLEELLPSLLSRMERAFSIDAAAALLCTGDGSALIVRASHGPLEKVEEHSEIPVGPGIAGAVAMRRQAVIVDDVAAIETRDPLVRDLSSMMAAPLVAGGDLLGVVHVGTRKPRDFTGPDLHLFRRVADQVSLAVGNALAGERTAATTERQGTVETALQESAGRWRTLAEVDPNGILVMDDRSIILAANPAVERIFGYGAGELVGKSMSILIPERFRAAHHTGVQRYLATGERNIPWTGAELTGLMKSGREIPVEIGFGEYVEEGKHVFAGFVQDLSERKRVEARRVAEHRVARILASNAGLDEAGPSSLAAICGAFGWDFGAFWVPAQERLRCDAMWHHDGATLTGFAEATRGITFASGEGLPGRVWRDASAQWIDDVLRDRNFPRVEAASAAGLHAAFAVPVLMDGEVEGVMEFFTCEWEQPDEALLGTLEAIGHDVGQYLSRRRAERERDRALAEALAASALADEANRAKSGFLAAMSHELRTPLNAIVGYADLIQTGIPVAAPEATLKHVERIDVASHHLLSLIEEILGFARLEAGHETIHLEWFDACDVIKDVHAIIEPLARAKEIHLRVSTPDRPLHMRSDPQRLRQILINLLDNSVKFTDQGDVELVVREEGKDIHFQVRDTGLGIEEAHLEKMFEPFWQADQSSTRTAGGTGLGLAVTVRLARALNGTMSAESDVGHGTTITVRMPLETADANPDAVSSHPQHLP